MRTRLKRQIPRSIEMPGGGPQLRAALARQSHCVLLESGAGFGALGRYSIYAARPRAVFRVLGNRWQLSSGWPAKRPHRQSDPLAALRSLLAQTAVGDEGDLPIFAGGWMGYIGYDIAPLIEQLPRRCPRTSALPDLYLAYYDTFALLDHHHDLLQILALDPFAEGEAARSDRLAEFCRCLQGEPPPEDGGGAIVTAEPVSDFSPDEYCWTVNRVLEYIRAGDIFQANFAHRFSTQLTGSVEQLYHRCVAQSPCPFGALIRAPGWSVISTSPERFFCLSANGRIETRPIKGTRPRGQSPDHDLLLRSELEANPKDRAELTMIVDLERNDLGRVCEYGSVRVSRHAEVESYSNVHHLVSTIEGQLGPRYDRVDLLRAMFPGGSITGAPKIRAMQIIDELERCRRGAYTGAIGYLSDHGRADFSIAIRILVVDGSDVSYHVGGGIVADSQPLAEYHETLAKGRRLYEVLLGR